MPDNELPFAAESANRGRTVADLIAAFLQGQGAPFFFAGVAIESNGDAARAADQADELITVEQRMSGEAPQRHRGLVILGEMFRPQHFAIVRVETEQVPHRSECVDLA